MDDDRKRKEAFFEALYRTHYRRLLRQANAFFGYKKQFFHLAENAVQETFFQAFQVYETFSRHPNQGAWLTVVLRRRLYLYGKEAENLKRLLALDENALPPVALQNEGDGVEAFLQREETRDLVRRLTEPLNEKDKRLLHLYYGEQKSTAEIAAIFGTSDRVIRTKLYRIRKKLKKIFENGIFLLTFVLFFHI